MFIMVQALKKQDMDHFLSVMKSIQLLLLLFLIANLLDLTCADLPYADLPYPLCLNTSNYAANSSFENNLYILVSSLASNASVSQLYNTSIGDEPDKIYGQYMCYPTNQSCSTCISLASQNIMQLCPNDLEAVVWEENCQLRYSNQSFLGHLDISGNRPLANKKNISNPEQFRSVVNDLLTKLTERAAYNRSTMYATGEATFTDVTESYTLYALVQCTTDLSQDDCNTCLQVAIANVSSQVYFSRGARLLSRSCYLRYELYSFYDAATEPRASQVTGKSNQTKTWMIIILTVTSALLVVALLGFFVYSRAMRNETRKWNNKIKGQDIQLSYIGDQHNPDVQHQNFQGRDGLNAPESAFMDLASILAATNNFSYSNLLGEGGFGPVYKGALSNGKEVAVKRLSSCSEQGTEEFTNEVLLIMKLQHKNLVRLLGFCVDREEKLLVYEFMPNSSLDVVLFDRARRARLNWSQRINIINGIAKGILYLHEDSRLRVIHRDLKASNILLDIDMNFKVSDFGMARIFAGGEGSANTARIVGTYGYMAPEYAMEGLYSTKSDVYGFGVLTLEIITGRRNVGFNKSKRAPGLIAHAWQLLNEGNELDLMDPLLTDSCSPDEFSRHMHIGLLCVQQDACDRPTMSSAVLMLKSETVILPQPEQPAFSAGRFADLNETYVEICSTNGLTISNISAR